MSNFDFKLIYEEKLEKKHSLKPLLTLFFLGIIPLFYAIWVFYSYFNLNNLYFEKEAELLQTNLQNDKYRKNSKFMMLTSRKKQIIDKNFIRDLKTKRKILLNKKDGEIKGFLNFTSSTIEIMVNNKKERLLLNQPSVNLSFNPNTEEIIINERKISDDNLRGGELFIPQFKGRLDISTLTGEISFPKTVKFPFIIPQLKTLYRKDDHTSEIILAETTGEISFNLYLNEKMVFPVQEDRLLVYKKIAGKIKNINLLKTLGNDLPLKKYINLKPVTEKMIKINKIEFFLNDRMELIMNSSFSAENYDKAKEFLEILDSMKYYRNIKVQTIFPGKEKITIQFSTFIELEAHNG